MTIKSVVEWLETRLCLAVPSLSAGVLLQAGGSNIAVSWESTPEAADWNGDGKLDLLCGQFTQGKILFYANTGSGSNPQLAAGTEVQANGGPITTSYY